METYTITTSSELSVTATATEEGTNNGPGAGGMVGSQALALEMAQCLITLGHGGPTSYVKLYQYRRSVNTAWARLLRQVLSQLAP